MNVFKNTIAVSVSALCEAFGRTPSDATFRAYQWGLEGLSAEDVQRATRLALRQCRSMPAPAELRELVASTGDGADGRASKAWYSVERAVQDHGYMKTVNFDDPLINAAIRLIGGWQRYCSVTVDEFDKWLRKDFIAEYVKLVKSPPSPELCLPSPGEAVRTNGFHHRHDEVVPLVTGLDIGPLQRRLAHDRGAIERRADVPQVEFQKP